jgi:hypothetical protein
MLSFYCLAVIVALGHHLFYNYLDGRVVKEQAVGKFIAN